MGQTWADQRPLVQGKTPSLPFKPSCNTVRFVSVTRFELGSIERDAVNIWGQRLVALDGGMEGLFQTFFANRDILFCSHIVVALVAGRSHGLPRRLYREFFLDVHRLI